MWARIAIAQLKILPEMPSQLCPEIDPTAPLYPAYAHARELDIIFARR